MPTNIDSLSINITANTGSAANSIKKLSESLKKLNDATSKVNLGNTAQQMKLLADATSKLGSGWFGMTSLASALTRISKVNTSGLNNVAAQLSSVATAVNLIDNETITRMERIANALSQLQFSKTAFNSLMRTAASAPGLPNLSGSTPGGRSPSTGAGGGGALGLPVRDAAFATQEFEKFRSVLGGVGTALSKVAKISLSPVTMAARSIGNGFKNATKKVSETFAALKRIAVYRLLRTMLKEITQALNEGIKNLYQYSTVMGAQFHKSMDLLATDALYIKDSLAAMVSPIINAVAPAIDVLTDKFVALLNYVNQFISSLTGKETWTAAKKIPTVFEDAEDGAKNTAKAIKSWTVGIDELNIIEDTSGSRSGKAGNALDYSTLFEERKVDSEIASLADKMKSAFESQNWKALGETIGTSLNTAVNNINWAGMGENVGKKVSGVIETLNSAEMTFDFTNLGEKVGTALTTMVKNINWTSLGSLMMGFFTNAVDTIVGFVNGVDWNAIGKAIHDFVTGFFDRFTAWITGDNGKKLGLWQVVDAQEVSLLGKLKSFFAGLDLADIASSFFEALGAAFGFAVGTLWEAIQEICEGILSHFKQYLYNEDGTLKTGFDLAAGIIEAFQNFDLTKVLSSLETNVTTPLGKGFWSGFGKATGGTTGTTALTSAVTSLQNATKDSKILSKLLGVGKTVGEKTTEKIPDVMQAKGTEAFSSLADGVNAAGKDKKNLENIKKIAQDFCDPFGQVTDDSFWGYGSSSTSQFQNSLKAAKPNMLKVMSGLANASMTSFNKADGKTTLTDRIGNIATAMASRFQANTTKSSSGTKSVFTKLGNAVMSAFNGEGDKTLTNRMGNIASTMGGRFQSKITAAQPGLKKAMSDTANASMTAFNAPTGKTLTERMGTIGTNMMSGVGSGVTSGKSGMIKVVASAGKLVGDTFYSPDGKQSLYDRAKGQGTNVTKGVSTGVTNGQGAMIKVVASAGKLVGDTFYNPTGKQNLYDRLKVQGGNGTAGFADGFSFTQTQKNTIGNAGTTAVTQFKNNTTGGVTNSSTNKFYGIATDSATGYKNGINDASGSAWFKTALQGWASSVISVFSNKLKVGSPSKVFEEIGGFTVEGYNNGIEQEGKSTAGIVSKWANSFTHIPAAFAIDTTAIDTYDPGRYIQSVQTEVANHSSLSVEGVADGMEVFFDRMLAPVLMQIADDTRRQADKNEQMVVTLDGRVLTKAVERQQRANGLRFVPA